MYKNNTLNDLEQWANDEVESVVMVGIVEKTYNSLPWYTKLRWKVIGFLERIINFI